MTAPPRVFVSSVVDGFEDRRASARQGIEAAGCEPILVPEDFPALSKSSRNACLDGVESCEALVVIVGKRGGWHAPSGRLVVEEEFDHARSRGLPTLVFLEEAERDADAKALCKKLGHYVDGRFRRTFSTPTELTKLVKAACMALIVPARGTMDAARFKTLLLQPEQMQQPVLRVVIAPERAGEDVFPIEVLDNDDFNESLVALARKRDVGVFDPYVRVQRKKTGGSLVVLAAPENASSAGRTARLEVAEDGWLIFDLAVREPGGGYDTIMLPVAAEDVEECAKRAFRMGIALYEMQDPFARQASLLVNGSLGHLGHQMLAYRKDRESMKGRINMQSLGGGAHAVVGFEHPEKVARSDKRWVVEVAGKLVRRIERRQNNGGNQASFG